MEMDIPSLAMGQVLEYPQKEALSFVI